MFLVCSKRDYDKFSCKSMTCFEDELAVYHTVEEVFHDTDLDISKDQLVIVELGSASCIKQVTPALVKYVPKKASK